MFIPNMLSFKYLWYFTTLTFCSAMLMAQIPPRDEPTVTGAEKGLKLPKNPDMNPGEFSRTEISAFLKVFTFLQDQLEIELKQTRDQNKSFLENRLRCSKEESSTEASIVCRKQEQRVSLTSLLYTNNNQLWSPCLRSCTTSRIRKCRLESVCVIHILVEEALCYVPGSKCEENVKAIMREDAKETSQNPSNDDYEADFKYDGKETSFSEHKKQDNLHIDYEDKNNFHYFHKDVIKNITSVDSDFADSEYDSNFHMEDYHDYYIDEVEEETTGKRKKKNEDSESPTVGVQHESPVGGAQCGKSATSVPQTMFRIIGGWEAIKNSWPWQVAILNRFKEVFCGGTIIGPRWVLTAAHCVRKKLFVRIHEHDIRVPDGEKEFRVKKSFKHPDFDLESIDSDIALLKLPKDVLNDLPRPLTMACLPDDQGPLPLKESCVALGWGKRKKTHIFGSDVLRYVKVPIVSKKACQNAYESHEITENMFCAGVLRGGFDACEGDSGGPLLCQNEKGSWVIQGVISFGDGCGDNMRLGVYVKVSNYVQWINQTISSNDAD